MSETQGLGRAARDPLIAALARYVAGLDRRYPEGPRAVHQVGLDERSIITRMPKHGRDPAA
jgi:hypothetical protein